MVSRRTALLTLASAVAAQNSTSKCPTGFVEGFNSQVLDIVAQPADVWKLIGDFGDLSWAGVAQTNLSDAAQDNVPGVSRTSVQLAFFINETLLAYSPFDGASLTASELHSVAPFSVRPTLNTTVSAYADSLGVSPLCGGAATRLTFDVNYCAEPAFASIVDTLFTTAHSSQLLSAQTLLDAQTYTESACVGGTIVSSNTTTSTNGTSAAGSASGAASGRTTTLSTAVAGATSTSTAGDASTAGTTGKTGSSNTTGTSGTTGSNTGSSAGTTGSNLPKASTSSASTLTSSFLSVLGLAMASLML